MISYFSEGSKALQMLWVLKVHITKVRLSTWGWKGKRKRAKSVLLWEPPSLLWGSSVEVNLEAIHLPSCSWNEQNTGPCKKTGATTDSVLKQSWPMARKASVENSLANQNQLQRWIRVQRASLSNSTKTSLGCHTLLEMEQDGNSCNYQKDKCS